MYEVTMSICDLVLKDQVCNTKLYEDIDERQDTLALLKIIKKTMYSNGDDDAHMGYNHVIAVSNYYRVQEERFQSLQYYQDQFIVYRKLCEQLGIKIGESEDRAANVLKKEHIVYPAQQQKDEAAKKAVEEHHAILIILGADKYKYGKLLKDMKNDVILKKDLFPKTVAKACQVLSKWCNSYGNYSSGKVDSNDGIAFTAVTDKKEVINKNEKKKGIMCFKCKKKGHYSNECTEELPATSETKGTNLLINKEDSSDDEVQSDDEEVNDDLQKSSTDHDSEKEENDSCYKEDTMFSDDNYKGFAFVQDVHDVNCNMNTRQLDPS